MPLTTLTHSYNPFPQASNPEQDPDPQGPAEFPRVPVPEFDPELDPFDPAEPQRNPDE